MDRGMTRDRSVGTQLPFWPSMTPLPEKTVRATRSPRAARSARTTRNRVETPEERAVRERLQGRMSARVALKNNKGKGSFTVHFASYDQLDEIMRRIDA
jgi:hypothetical protein